MGKFKVSLGFCAAVCILAWLDLSLCGSFLLCGLCHELGHLIALRLCRIPVEKIMVGTVGAVICARFSDYSRELICAAAGPAAGMILAGALFRCAPKVALVSVLLSAVNLLPLYPMDGGRILGYFLPDRALDFLERYQQQIQMIFMAVILFTNILDVPLGFLQGMVLNLLDSVTSLGGFLPHLM